MFLLLQKVLQLIQGTAKCSRILLKGLYDEMKPKVGIYDWFMDPTEKFLV